MDEKEFLTTDLSIVNFFKIGERKGFVTVTLSYPLQLLVQWMKISYPCLLHKSFKILYQYFSDTSSGRNNFN